MGNHEPDDFSISRATQIETPQVDLPVPLNGRNYCGELDIRIDRAGKWYYNGSPIGRKVMVGLFASLLMRAKDGVYWLVSPTEMGRIDVEDAPFVITHMSTKNQGEDQTIEFCTNVDISVTVSEDCPILMKPSPLTGEMTPYVVMPGNIDARIERAVYYDLVDLGVIMDFGDEEIFGVWSSCSFFPLGSLQDTDA
ncbi:DUF1285 domain-containing protein [Magnetovibrio sp.]|uniref:DUF1285 domain-containing protein n=1 Tax=Magnetovibrio sp. TaxID=2024836 RepID=UPI002F91CF38